MKLFSCILERSATILINGNINEVFPLFGAFEERKWAAGWNPVMVYPAKETIAEGVTFTTPSHTVAAGEDKYTWVIIKYQPAGYTIQYLVMTPHRFWTITVACSKAGNKKTSVQVTYSYTGLNDTGNKLNALAIDNMFSHNLVDWEQAINHYLETGKTVNLH